MPVKWPYVLMQNKIILTSIFFTLFAESNIIKLYKTRCLYISDKSYIVISYR
jgi:hypothetical protein